MAEQALQWPEVQQWLSDPEFSELDYNRKQQILDNYFDQELADDEFFQLDNEEQSRIKGNFATAHIGEAPEPEQAMGLEEPESYEALKAIPAGLAHGTLGIPQSVGRSIEYAGHRIEHKDWAEDVAQNPKQFYGDLPLSKKTEVNDRRRELMATMPQDEALIQALQETLRPVYEKRAKIGPVVSEIGETAAEYYKEARTGYEAPERLRGKNVLDNHEIMGDLTWWTYNVSDMLPTLVASMLPAMGTYRGIQVLGTAAGKSPQAIAGLAKIGAIVTGGAAGGGLESAGTYDQMLEQGVSEDEAARASEFMFLFAGALNTIGTAGFLTKVGNGFMGKIAKGGLAGVVEGLTEGAEEPAEVSAKILAKLVTGQEIPDNIGQMYIESLKDAATVAPIAGITSLGGAAMGGSVNQEVDLLAPPSDKKPPGRSNKAINEINGISRWTESSPGKNRALRSTARNDGGIL
jgi:hypothetical protein